MKSLFYIAIVALFLQPFSGKAQIAQKNKVFIDGYYGFPNLIGFTLKRKVNAFSKNVLQDLVDLDIGGNGPYGGKIEYMFHDHIGVSIGANASYSYAVFDGIDTLNIQRHYEITRNVLRILPRINFHMLSHEKADLFAGIGIGYNGSQWKFITDDPNFNSRDFNGIPVAFRLFVGGRYFFTDFLGLNLEMGIGGGGLLQGGISFRI